MQRLIVKSKVDRDGILRVTLPIGEAEADREVQLTIDPIFPPSETSKDYLDFLEATAGTWQGDFERPQQGEYETRDAF